MTQTSHKLTSRKEDPSTVNSSFVFLFLLRWTNLFPHEIFVPSQKSWPLLVCGLITEADNSPQNVLCLLEWLIIHYLRTQPTLSWLRPFIKSLLVLVRFSSLMGRWLSHDRPSSNPLPPRLLPLPSSCSQGSLLDAAFLWQRYGPLIKHLAAGYTVPTAVNTTTTPWTRFCLHHIWRKRHLSAVAQLREVVTGEGFGFRRNFLDTLNGSTISVQYSIIVWCTVQATVLVCSSCMLCSFFFY